MTRNYLHTCEKHVIQHQVHHQIYCKNANCIKVKIEWHHFIERYLRLSRLRAAMKGEPFNVSIFIQFII